MAVRTKYKQAEFYDNEDHPDGPIRGIYTGQRGNFIVVSPAGDEVKFVNVPEGTFLDIMAKRVKQTNTTVRAANVVFFF